MNRTRSLGMRPATVALALIFAFVVGELATRLFVPRSAWLLRDASADWVRDDTLGWVQAPGLDVESRHAGGVVSFRTNEDGLTPAGATPARRPGLARVMLFGDSGVVGRAVAPEQRLHAHLERLLRERGVSAEVYNAGVEGYSTDQSLLRMERLVPRYEPDVVIYGLHPNDFGGNVSREAYRNAKPMFVLDEEGSLELLLPEFASAEIVSRRGHGWKGAIQRSALYRMLQPLILKVRIASGTWSERNLHGIALEAIYHRPEELERFDWKLLGALLRRMDQVARDSGAPFFFYQHPDVAATWEPYIERMLERSAVDPARHDRYALEQRLEACARDSGVAFCPLIGRFATQQARGPFHLLPQDPHCSSAGYEVTAETLAAFLGEIGVESRLELPAAVP